MQVTGKTKTGEEKQLTVEISEHKIEKSVKKNGRKQIAENLVNPCCIWYNKGMY